MGYPQHITILGGGLAGLSAGFYAKAQNLPFSILEGEKRLGGFTTTFTEGRHIFDAGAHFFFDRNPEITADVAKLLGDNFCKIDLSSQIYYNGQFINFPLSPLNVLESMGCAALAKSYIERVLQRLTIIKNIAPGESFEHLVIKTYGKTIAEAFFLNHSYKQWGLPCSQLSKDISGGKLKPLKIWKTIGDRLRNKKKPVFSYYPTMGIGMIVDKLAEQCRKENVNTESQITSILHKENRIRMVEVNTGEKCKVDHIVSTIPLNKLVQMMQPEPPKDILEAAAGLSFRDILLVVLFINKPSIHNAASMHFPDATFPVTRVHEPKNRSKNMSPIGETCLVAEVPCSRNDEFWNMSSDRLLEMISTKFSSLGLFAPSEYKGGIVKKMVNAYPVLELGYNSKVEKIINYLSTFDNIFMTGRNGSFRYISMHHVMESAKEVISNLAKKEK